MIGIDPTPELTFSISAILGDGCSYKDGYKWTVQFDSADKNLVDFVNNCLAAVLKRNLHKLRIYKSKYGTTIYRLRVRSKSLFYLLRDKPSIRILAMKFPLSFIRAFFLCEGNINRCHNGEYAKIRFYNTELFLISVGKEVLEILGFQPVVYGPYEQHGFGKKPIYVLCLRKAQVKPFLEMVS